MTFTSVAQANSKTAEFARLFDLFDRVATRRARTLTGDTSEAISADDIANIPAEFAPVLKNLSTVLSLRARRDEEHTRREHAASTTKPRHNTPIDASSARLTVENTTSRVDMMGPSYEVKEENDNLSFPPRRRYPFTFKLMLHKLYDLDEWAEKVESAVEASKSQFKPLAEPLQNVVRGTNAEPKASAKEREEKRGRSNVRPVIGASAKFKPPNATRRTHSTAAVTPRDAATTNTKERGERRSSVRPVLGTSAKFKPPSTSRLALTFTKPEPSRVLKKRCIGRRKSINGPMATGVWVYDAAISAIEVAGSRPAVEITLSAPRDHGAGCVVESRVRHRSLTAVEDMHSRNIAKRKIKITVSLSQEERAESVPPQVASISFAEPAQVVTETGRSVKKRRSMAS